MEKNHLDPTFHVTWIQLPPKSRLDPTFHVTFKSHQRNSKLFEEPSFSWTSVPKEEVGEEALNKNVIARNWKKNKNIKIKIANLGGMFQVCMFCKSVCVCVFCGVISKEDSLDIQLLGGVNKFQPQTTSRGGSGEERADV